MHSNTDNQLKLCFHKTSITKRIGRNNMDSTDSEQETEQDRNISYIVSIRTPKAINT